MTRSLKITRRAALSGSAALAAAASLPAAAQSGEWDNAAHGLSIYGDLKEKPDFRHFDFVNPDAPKGGSISLQISQTMFNQAFATFNTLNIFILKGDGAAGMDATFDALMSATLDEPDAAYGLIAEKVIVSADKRTYRFLFRKEARWHDGSAITPDDFIWTLQTFKTKGHPSLQQILRDVQSAEAESERVLKITLAPDAPKTLPLTVAGLPILSKAYYSKVEFDETTLVPPLGSGPYKAGRFESGRFIEFERVPDYWGRDLPVNKGLNNFDRMRYQYYRDRDAAFEGFKARDFTYREEFTSIHWATRYDFPAVASGRVKREEIPDPRPQGPQMFWLNSRRKQFQDRRIREAMTYCFDYEWMNQNLMYSSYGRMHSFFENSDMKASGKPPPEELKLLEPWRGRIPDAAFGEAVVPPVSDKSGQDRNMLRKANQLLMEAGCKRDGARLLLPDGTPFTIEKLDFEPSIERHAQAFFKMLKLVGIEATVRRVDAPQYQRRVEEFDFDIISFRLGGVFTPGDALKNIYASESADRRGSRNAAGLKSPAVDALIDIINAAPSRAELNTACRALDRVLRAEHIGIFSWFKATKWLATWDMFGRPEKSARYGVSAPAAWWADAEKAKRITG